MDRQTALEKFADRSDEIAAHWTSSFFTRLEPALESLDLFQELGGQADRKLTGIVWRCP